MALDLDADFAARQLRGRATLTFERAVAADHLVLDTRALTIERITTPDGAGLSWELGPPDPILGRPLTVRIPAAAADRVVVHYATSPDAAALQWLAPAQTAGGAHPFLFSQGQAILTRTWIPTQDSPGIRQTYAARLTVPAGLRAVMSAEAVPASRDGSAGLFEFRLDRPVPPYLIALAIGDLAFRPLGARSGVYAEPATLDRAADEFADVNAMIDAAEGLLGEYLWGRYDILVLPPSFPFGGMENPLLTFATPTILAGDRSLVALVAHELAHSWSGNLVTNATWSDFWLNEGVTTYVERRIMEALHGRAYADMLDVLGRRDLLEEIAHVGGPSSRDTVLHIDLSGRDPDEGATRIPYDKGAALMRLLEETVGRPRFDRFLRAYFSRFAFQSITTATFVDYLAEFLGDETVWSPPLRLREWIYEPGLPVNAIEPASATLATATAQAQAFAAGAAAASLDTDGWGTFQWLQFLHTLPERLETAHLTDLDETFGFTGRGNSEVLFAWLRIAIRHRYGPAMPALERFLTIQGRRKFLRPLYEDLVRSGWGRAEAKRIYARARPGYHAVATSTLDPIVGA